MFLPDTLSRVYLVVLLFVHLTWVSDLDADVFCEFKRGGLVDLGHFDKWQHETHAVSCIFGNEDASTQFVHPAASHKYLSLSLKITPRSFSRIRQVPFLLRDLRVRCEVPATLCADHLKAKFARLGLANIDDLLEINVIQWHIFVFGRLIIG